MKIVRVAAAAIIKHGQVLIARRPDYAHQGGLWEFPGGKIESGETVKQALTRELQEEINITPTRLVPLITVTHHYSDKSVHLDVWKVTDFEGEPKGLEGQPIQWRPIQHLDYHDFPAANKPIIDAVNLPSFYAISGHWQTMHDFRKGIQSAINKSAAMIQLRFKGLEQAQVKELIAEARQLCQSKSVKLMLNTDTDIAELIEMVDGVHLSSQQSETIDRSLLVEFPDKWVGISCHSETEIDRATELGANYISVSPIATTRSHPDQEPIGWDRFRELTEYSTLPVYALGGMTLSDLDNAIGHGGQGIAAISEFWS